MRFLIIILIGIILPVFLYAQKADPRLISHSKATILSENAKVTDWKRFNGPKDSASSPETHLLEKWDEKKPVVLWEKRKGEGYSSPAIGQGTLVLFHRENGMEIIEGLTAETGQTIWNYQYPVKYRDRYGYSNGPRASPVIDEGLVYAHGVTSWLTCLDLETGKPVWKRNLGDEFKIPNYFFGKGSNPIINKEHLILNVGGSENRCVVGFNKKTGKTEWICKDEWGASYSSPTMATIHGKKVCLVLTGGESRPPTGGLLAIDPENGKKLNRFSWRSSRYESANAVPPIPCGKNRVFLSECYEKGGVVLEYDEYFNTKIIWSDNKINIHWMTPVIKDGIMYGIAGRHQQGAEVFALNLLNGKIFWKEAITWNETIQNREAKLGLFRGSILKLENDFLCLSELGSLVNLKMTKDEWIIKNKIQLFFAPGTWTLPALSKGLLYIMQNETDRLTGNKARLLCLDLRKSDKN